MDGSQFSLLLGQPWWEGDPLDCDVPAGRRRYRVLEVVHQSEAAGGWDR